MFLGIYYIIMLTKRRGLKRSGTKRSGTKRRGSKRSGTKRSGSKRSGSKYIMSGGCRPGENMFPACCKDEDYSRTPVCLGVSTKSLAKRSTTTVKRNNFDRPGRPGKWDPSVKPNKSNMYGNTYVEGVYTERGPRNVRFGDEEIEETYAPDPWAVSVEESYKSGKTPHPNKKSSMRLR